MLKCAKSSCSGRLVAAGDSFRICIECGEHYSIFSDSTAIRALGAITDGFRRGSS